jgi:hypothetical protein
MSKHPMRRAVATGAAVLLSSLSVVTLSGQGALAAVPTNDTIAGIVAVGSLPYTQTLDVTEATTDADDAQLNASCGAPATQHSVWYSYTAATDGGFVVDVRGSDFPAAAIIGTGTPGALETAQCGSWTVGTKTTAGTTYYILVFDYNEDPDPGGTLHLTIDTAPPPPIVTLSVDPRATLHVRENIVTLTGTYSCTDHPNLRYVYGTLQQRIGGRLVTGEFQTSGGLGGGLVCDGTAQPWYGDVQINDGQFVGGKAVVHATAVGCYLVFCGDATVEQTELLTGSGR